MTPANAPAEGPVKPIHFVLLAGLAFGAFITQALPFWDGDFTIFFAAIWNKSLAQLVGDLISPVTADTHNWGFLDHTVQLILYKISYMISGWDSWPYVSLRIGCYAGIGVFIYLWALRLSAACTKRAQWCAAAAAVFFVVAPSSVASMSWVADFAPVAEFAFSALAYLVWAEVERTPAEWTSWNFMEEPARRAWLAHWAGIAVLIYVGYKTKSDVKLIPAILIAYLALTRRAQWKVFAPPLALMTLLAVPWNPDIFRRLPPFVPGAQHATEGFMWQPARLGPLMEFVWSRNQFKLEDSSLALGGLLGPFLLAGIGLLAIVFLTTLAPSESREPRSFAATPQGRARLFVILWFFALLAGATTLPELNYFYRIRYGMVTILPVCILLGAAFGWLCEVRTHRWLIVVSGLLYLAQAGINLDRSVHYRRQFATVEVGVDQTYEWISSHFPNDDLALMPDFLSYDYHQDAPAAIHNRRRISGLDELARGFAPNRTTVLSWQVPASPVLRQVARFDGCSTASWFDRIMGCKPDLAIYVSRYVGVPAGQAAGQAPTQPIPTTAQALLNRSFELCRQGKPMDCIAVAQQAIRLKPDYAEAYNNIAAAWESIGRWDEAIAAATEAIRIQPDFQLAKNNLAWSLSQKKINAPPPASGK